MSQGNCSGIARVLLVLLIAGATGCANARNAVPPSSPVAPGTDATATSESPIRHVVLLIQENRSFDDFFATFPGADGTTTGKIPGGKTIRLRQVPLSERCDFGHAYRGFIADYDGGRMDGFALETGGPKCPGNAGAAAYQYVEPEQIKPYWDIAKQYVLADHMFQTQGSGSFTAHQDLIAAGTTLDTNRKASLVDFPSHAPWGCDAPKGTTAPVLVYTSQPDVRPALTYLNDGPFPCVGYKTLRDRLDAKGLSWTYYAPGEPGNNGAYWSAFDAIKAVRDGPEWHTNVRSEKAIFHDIKMRTLANVAWVVPDLVNSDHPTSGSDTGPSWVASIVNAIGRSTYWNSTVIVVLWDDWGGFYDHVPPPFFDNWGGLGFRVPMMVVSAYARKGRSPEGGYIVHTQYEFGSILRFIEDRWRLGSLGKTDARAESIAGCLDYSQQPRAFHAIEAKYSQSYFERQPPSNRPVDTQ